MLWFTLIALLLVAAAALAAGRRRRIVVPCELDLEATHDHFHAHVELEGVAPNPGDAVQVEDAPTRLAFGEKRRVRSRAAVRCAGPMRRAWTRLVGAFSFQDLYDVGFE